MVFCDFKKLKSYLSRVKKNRNLPPGHAIYSIRFQQATLTCPTSWKTKWKKEGQTWGRTRIGHCLHNAGMCIKTHKNSAPYEYQLFFKLEFSKATLSLKPARFQCELKSWSLIIHPFRLRVQRPAGSSAYKKSPSLFCYSPFYLVTGTRSCRSVVVLFYVPPVHLLPVLVLGPHD